MLRISVFQNCYNVFIIEQNKKLMSGYVKRETTDDKLLLTCSDYLQQKILIYIRYRYNCVMIANTDCRLFY